MQRKLYLILENGSVFEGFSFGAEGETIGELVFTTSMTGYLEALTDPSYYGQVVIQTFPLIGNYGVIPEDFESNKCHMRAYVVREWCKVPSNFRCQGDLDNFLKRQGVIGLYGIDTRAVTRIVREYGVMNAKIIQNINNVDIDEIIAELKAYKIINAIGSVSTTEIRTEGHGKHVVLWDFGAKASIGHELIKRGSKVTVVPAKTSAEDVMALRPDGIMLSNGPGDPSDNLEIAKEIAKVCEARIPVFGVCMGHQLLALSQGAKTAKLKYGHRGENQPAKYVPDGRVYITSQNHGYSVVSESLQSGARVSFINANDGTCEGIEYDYMPAFSVQFHPEASAGPLDTAFLFDKFIALMGDIEYAVK